MEITHDKTRHMFEFTENGSSAVVEYKPFDGGINILHTFVPKPLKIKAFSVIYGAPEGIRIPDLPLRRRMLYPTELLAHI